MSEDRPRCAVCGTPLRESRIDAGLCASYSCAIRSRTRALAPPLRPPQAESAELRAAVERRTLDHEQELRSRHGPAIPDPLIHARLPANERRIVPLPAERREAFAGHLRAALDRAIETPDADGPTSPEAPPRHAALIGASCASCRGSCCSAGGDRAFLHPDHLRRYLREHPGISPEALMAAYLARLPADSVADSCVYHTATGCAQPRETRANICNSFLCGPLEAMLRAQPVEGPLLPVLASCLRDHSAELVRSAVFDGDGNALLPPGPASPV